MIIDPRRGSRTTGACAFSVPRTKIGPTVLSQQSDGVGPESQTAQTAPIRIRARQAQFLTSNLNTVRG